VKAVILAGGLGSRLGEETGSRPKPMVEIGEHPILWHIMKTYAAHGIDDFVICLGYRGYVIKEYFANYALHASDVRIDLASGGVEVLSSNAEPWTVTLVDTGLATQTGGRIARVLPLLGEEPFCLTYGDGVGDVDIAGLVEFHRAHGHAVTMTAVQPSPRFGSLGLDGDRVVRFKEKDPGDGWVNGGFFVVSPGVSRYLGGDDTVWEREPLERLTSDGELIAFRHSGFWHPMDTIRDRRYLEELWASGAAPWTTRW
jgi:glucose-1-phosphate cytidylyltransferase